jgi:hypothetical protein
MVRLATSHINTEAQTRYSSMTSQPQKINL